MDNLYEVSEVVRKSTEWLTSKDQNFTIRNAPDTWAIGQRMAMTVRTQDEAENLIELAKQFKVGGRIA